MQYDNVAVYMVVLERVVLEVSTYYTNFLDLNWWGSVSFVYVQILDLFTTNKKLAH